MTPFLRPTRFQSVKALLHDIRNKIRHKNAAHRLAMHPGSCTVTLDMQVRVDATRGQHQWGDKFMPHTLGPSCTGWQHVCKRRSSSYRGHFVPSGSGVYVHPPRTRTVCSVFSKRGSVVHPTDLGSAWNQCGATMALATMRATMATIDTLATSVIVVDKFS